MREHVVAAAHAMKSGNWIKCRDFILSIKACYIWGLNFITLSTIFHFLSFGTGMGLVCECGQAEGTSYEASPVKSSIEV